MHQLAERHGGNKVCAIIIYSLTDFTSCGDTFDPSMAVMDLLDVHAAQGTRAPMGQGGFALFPHHPGTEAGIMELLDQRGDSVTVLPLRCSEDCVAHRFCQRQILDPLSGPIGGNLIAWNAPDLFSI